MNEELGMQEISCAVLIKEEDGSLTLGADITMIRADLATRIVGLMILEEKPELGERFALSTVDFDAHGVASVDMDDHILVYAESPVKRDQKVKDLIKPAVQ